MGVFRKLLGRSGRQQGASHEPPQPAPPPPPRAGAVRLFDGPDQLQVVGESFHQDALWALVGGPRADSVLHEVVGVLVPEEDNPYDPNAVSVWVDGEKVGHLSREDARKYQRAVRAIMEREGTAVGLHGVIAGGGRGSDGTRMLGVFLSHNVVDFGLPEPPRATLRTGLSTALVTDEADDSYSLAWMDSLPNHPVKRIPHLRSLLGQASDPIERHYICAMLEADLYYCRETFPTALHEYDEVCEIHHSEMGTTMRPALIAKFGTLPLLETYKQASIRHQKSGDLQAALMWAQRGIEIYGDQAARPDDLADLESRVARLDASLKRREPVSRTRAARPKTPKPPQLLTCSVCGRQWERLPTTGRPPSRCNDCVA